METKHTPGPWYTAATDDSLVVKGKIKIASAFIDVPREEEEANARLIAAAPELLEALEKMVHAATYGTFDHADSHPLPMARAALAKAKGAA